VTLAGELVVRAEWDGSRITGVALASTRPHVAAQVLADRTAAEAVAIVPRLFSICGGSQAVAAALACEAASGRDADATPMAARERLVWGEMAREYLWRMLIDWPQLAGRAAAHEALASVQREIQASLAPDQAAVPFGAAGDAAGGTAVTLEAVRSTVQQHVLGEGEPWNALDDPAFGERWLDRRAAAPAELIARLLAERPAFGASDVALLPGDGASVARSIGECLDADPAFERAPTWHGAPAETGALARMHSQPFVAHVIGHAGRSAVARLLARVVELVGLMRTDRRPRAASCGAAAPGAGRGLGWVETARGLLVHSVELATGRVKRYRIVAPTEWNFHPRGALPAGLAGTAAADAGEVKRLVELAVQSLDPCVEARVEVAHV
jgi:hypothetical protein